MEKKKSIDAALVAALVSLATGTAALSEPVVKADNNKESTTKKQFNVAQKKETKKSTAESACGEGACGTDEKGAKAAKEKQAKDVKTPVKAASDKKNFKAREKKTSAKTGADSGCGEGSCGTDEKGNESSQGSTQHQPEKTRSSVR